MGQKKLKHREPRNMQEVAAGQVVMTQDIILNGYFRDKLFCSWFFCTFFCEFNVNPTHLIPPVPYRLYVLTSPAENDLKVALNMVACSACKKHHAGAYTLCLHILDSNGI